MGAPQMYYTSCESGLAGYPGFQFNAATPGVGDDVLRRVEQATSYEPPRSLGYQPTSEQIAGCPVNLCYLPGTDDQPAVLARTVFVGNDYSQRFGNYFVHALSLPPGREELDGALPIDFWSAGFWSATQSPGTELPELRPTPAAVFGRASAEAFLQDAGRLGWVPRLLTAVERAIVADERSVIVLESDSEKVARWISAVCHLLPPPMARRLSFATYSYRPGRGTENLVGTVPETDFTADESALRSYFLLDAVGGQISDGAVHPLAEMLAALGPEDAQTVWSLAEPLATGREPDFAAWYPIAVAGALRADLPLEPDALATMLRWLPSAAERLRPRLVADLVERCLDHDTLTLPHCLSLIGVATGTGDENLLADTEVRAFDLLLDEPSVVPARVPRPATDRGIAYGVEQITAALSRAADRPHDTLALIAVALDARLPLRPAGLAGYGRDLVAPILLDDPDQPIPDLLAKAPDVRRGVLDGLSAALSGRETAVLAVASRLSDVVGDDELAAYPDLSRMVLLARAARRPQDRLDTLIRLTGKGVPERSVITGLWPREWTLDEAAEIVRGAPQHYWESDHLLDRLDQVLARDDEPREAWGPYFVVTQFVEDRKLGPRLSPASEDRARGMVWSRQQIRSADRVRGRQLDERVHKLLGMVGHGERPVARWLTGQIHVLLLRLDPEHLVALLPTVDPTIRRHYREHLAATLGKRPDDEVMAIAARTFETRTRLARKDRAIADELDRAFAGTVARWKTRDLDHLEKMLAGSSAKNVPAAFTKWREAEVPRGIGRFLPRRRL
ncbi:hypothetical protein Q0Z83_022630 [Actinoplanes sichuanensis]|uniref:GTPase-associated protein 1-related protein n=1 Tax=Actinoplanes sichuanensis TaxID=512349 RepID=A0ABW4AJP5_9ACTN|nr:GTPase-associated protein 1-related protein [Actinoplanes sichuanensis]BEL04072.1 hypothetical protein Q0Z83_022630 [Actinoplanes sichuanensis]